MCVAFHITPAELREMPAKDVHICKAIRFATQLAEAYEWEHCRIIRGAPYAHCPKTDLPEYLSEKCMECIEGKTRSAMNERNRVPMQGNTKGR